MTDGRGGGPRISELEGEGDFNNLPRTKGFPLFFSSRTRICLKRLQKQKQKKLLPPTYLILLPATILNHARRESFGFYRISFHLRETRRRAL